MVRTRRSWHDDGVRQATVAASLVIDVVGYLAQHGCDTTALCAAAAVDPAVLHQPNARLDGAIMERLWAAGADLTGDPDLGLHTAETYNPGALDIVGYVVLSCRTAADALDRLARYAALLNDGLRVSLSRVGDRTVCRCDAGDQPDNYVTRAPRQVMEAMAAGIVCTVRRLTPDRVAALAVTFQHAAPKDVREHHRLFGPDVTFGAAANSVVYATADLDAPILSANPELLELFEPRAQGLIETLARHGRVSRRVLDVLGAHVWGVVPEIGDVARDLAMSERSLQRQLRAEGTSFRALVDECRRELALRHLAVPGASATDVAFLLGFSEPGAFTRAFRRWTGQSPATFRPAAETSSRLRNAIPSRRVPTR
jgi:AraC-like DNA-binding protein